MTKLARILVFACLALSPAAPAMDTERVAGDLYAFAPSLSSGGDDTDGGARFVPIQDPAPPTLSPSTLTVAEGDTARFRVAMHGISVTASVIWTLLPVAGTVDTADAADTGGVVAFSPATHTLTIRAGSTTGAIEIPIADDSDFEPQEAFAVRLLKARLHGGTTLSAAAVSTVTIPINDRLLVAVAPLDSASVAEGATANFRIRLNDAAGNAKSPPEQVVIEYMLSSGGVTTAMGGAADDAARDYTWPAGYDAGASTGRVTIQRTATSATVALMTVDDDLNESDEQIVIRIVRVIAGARALEALAPDTGASVTISDNDPITLVLVRTDPVSVETQIRENGAATFDVEIRPPGRRAAGAISVAWSAAVGTQTNTGVANTPLNADLRPAFGDARIAAGEVSATFMITAREDGRAESSETFTVILGSIDAAPGAGMVTLGTQTMAQATIQTNRAAIRFLSVRPEAGVTTVDESAQVTVTFVIEYTGAPPGEAEGVPIPVTVQWRFAGEAEVDVDYAVVSTPSSSRTLSFSARGTQTVSVQLTDDQLNEARERLIFEIISTADFMSESAAVTASATVHIADKRPDSGRRRRATAVVAR